MVIHFLSPTVVSTKMHAKMRDVRWIYSSTLILILVTITKCEMGSFEQCLAQDSISCLQMQLYRNARELFNQQSIDIVGGMTLVTNNNNRVAKSIEMVELEDSVENATNVMSRQEAIDKFLIRKTRDILVERTLKWNVGETARTFINSIPEEIKAKFTTYVTEARGKGKKLIRILVPLLIGLKLKMAAMSALTYLGIGFLAKKAILASFISLIVSGFIGLKKLMAAKQAGYNDIAPAYHPVPVWNPHSVIPGAMWPSHYDNHADPLAAQQLAYGTSKSR